MPARTAAAAGIVTLVFTDIEGSTRLLQRLGDGYPSAVEEHRRIVRRAIGAHAGQELGTEGDSFFVIYRTPPEAIASMVDAQRALDAHPWPDGTTIRIRVGIHTGTPVVVGGDYFGIDVHRAARIASAGHGGQILVSHVALDLCGVLPPGVSARDLGEHRLKDLDEPEHLYQLDIDGLPSTFPPLKSLGTPTNLPADAAPLFGRDRETSEIVELLKRDDVRLVTITGPGGTGKTRLASHVARTLINNFTHGVFFVALASVTDAARVPEAIEAQLELPEVAGRAALDNVAHHLRDRNVLLVLDNFEHVTAFAPAIATLLERAPRVKAVATSRAPLRIAAERELPLSPLALPPGGDREVVARSPAVSLFVERARAVKPAFELTEANAAAVAEICTRLDGLPLGIELAAARIRILTPEQMMARLGERLALLTGGRRDVPARQQTLRDAIGWSYDLLDEDAATLFRALGVFSSVSLEGVEAAAPAGMDPLTVLESLVDQSLLRRDEDDGGRFHMLETIREYALDRLEASGEASDARARHALAMAELAEKVEPGLRGPDHHRFHEILLTEDDNMRAALGWTLEGAGDRSVGIRLVAALGWFWYMRGRAVEGGRWLASAHAVATDAPVAVRAKIAHRYGIMLDQRADTEEAATVFREAVELFGRAGDRAGEATALNSLGVATRGCGRREEAAGYLRQSLELRRALGNRAGTASALFNLAELALDGHDLARAGELFAQAHEIDVETGDPWAIAVGISAFGIVALEKGDIETAGRHLREALGAFVEVGDDDRVAESVSNLAGEAGARGDLRRCARLAGAAHAMWTRLGLPLNEPDRAHFERHQTTARAGLTAEEFGRAWEEGRAMTTDQAVAYALDRGKDEGRGSPR